VPLNHWSCEMYERNTELRESGLQSQQSRKAYFLSRDLPLPVKKPNVDREYGLGILMCCLTRLKA
jgi:hypothetical protein